MEKTTFPEPDYTFWDKIDSFPEWQVICLWCDMEPTQEANSSGKAEVIQKMLTDARKGLVVNSNVRRTDYVNAKSNYEIWYDRNDLKTYASIMGEVPNFLLSQEERSQKSGASKEHDEPVTGHGATKLEDCRNKWEIPERLEYLAREIGQKWMDEQQEKAGKKPGVDAIAKYVDKELKNRNKTAPRGDYWDWETIKRQALTGITGRKANGKK